MDINQNKKIIASGGVIYRKNNGGEIIICHRTKTNLYALPKGKSENGENLENTALREVLEETGLQCKIIKSIGTIEYLVPQEGKYLPKEVTFFLMEIIGGNLENHDHEFDTVQWIEIQYAKSILTFESESDIVSRIIESESIT
ncbi:MAG: NUDIX hydrolase [SAR202 cluster bacterium]|nr:NTP pyrophosphohydrolase [Chloroflexota bacterium]MQG51022.1 NUDIX hydrolase [SAR202 cluster bacterium]|tara:strand:- start:2266 stop:2694 length:429 start_codon:yes stop_codon:yes gene_type:complete